MSIARKSAFGFAAQIYMLAVGLVMTIVVARLLGPEGKGIIAVIGATTSFAIGIASLGLTSSFSFFAGKDRYSRAEILWTMVLWSLILGAAVSAILWFGRGVLLGSVLKGMSSLELIAVLVSLPAVYFNAFAAQAYMGYGRVVMLGAIQAVVSTLNLIAILVSTMLLHSGTTGAVIALSAMTVLGSFVFIAAFGGLGSYSLASFCAVSADAIPYGLKAYVGGATQMFSLRADVFFLNYFAGPAAVGIYSVATNLAEKIWLLSNPVNTAVYSEIAGADEQDAARLATTTARAVAAIAGLAAVGMIALSIPLIPVVYGKAFSQATIALAILLPGTVALAASSPYYVYYTAQLGRPGVTSMLAVVSAIVSAVLYVLLIPVLGGLGAAIGSLASYALSIVAYGILFPRATGVRFAEMFVPKRADFDLYLSIVRRLAARLRFTTPTS